MKILILIQRWFGGHGSVAHSIKKRLEEKGHEVIIVSREDDLESFSFVSGIFPIIRELLLYQDYDIIYTFDWSIALTCLGFKNHYSCFHGITPSRLSRTIQKVVGNFMGNKLIVVGDGLKKIFPKSNLIYNGVDLEIFKPLGKERKYFGWVNKNSETKTREEIEEIAKQYNLPLLVAENTPYEQMNKFYNKLKVFASYPPEYAGFNMVWLEAMASGVPIVLGNDNGIDLPLNNKTPMNFRKYIISKKLTWRNHVEKLLEVFWKWK